ncbi:MAG: 7,8-dihydroneopterin aldolase/epimerase/oxygenase [Verrucomicrobiota bacterium]
MNSPDCIHVEQLEVFGRVGVTENERSKPQRLVLNLTTWPRENFDTMNDDIERTVNYSALCAAVREFMRAHSPRLVETLAANLAAHLLENFPIRKIDIELRKFVVPDTQYVSVALTREAGK